MPVDFLSDEQAARYGHYNQEPDEAQLFRYFHLDDEDKRLVEAHRGEHNRLGFALQLCTARFLGTFLEDPTAVPAGAVRYVAAQIGVADPICLERYHVPATRYLHTEEIRQRYGYREFSAVGLRLTRWLYARA